MRVLGVILLSRAIFGQSEGEDVRAPEGFGAPKPLVPKCVAGDVWFEGYKFCHCSKEGAVACNVGPFQFTVEKNRNPRVDNGIKGQGHKECIPGEAWIDDYGNACKCTHNRLKICQKPVPKLKSKPKGLQFESFFTNCKPGTIANYKDRRCICGEDKQTYCVPHFPYPQGFPKDPDEECTALYEPKKHHAEEPKKRHTEGWSQESCHTPGKIKLTEVAGSFCFCSANNHWHCGFSHTTEMAAPASDNQAMVWLLNALNFVDETAVWETSS